MTQQQKQPFWRQLLHPSNNSDPSLSPFQNINSLPEIKIITENDLKIESILMEEFRFRGDFLKQILNDVTSTFNLYFLFIGISLSGISITYQVIGKNLTYLPLLAILSFAGLGTGNALFFVRFISLVHLYERHKAVLNDIRAYYIKHLQRQIPDIRHVFRISLKYSFTRTYVLILYSIFAVLDSLLFAGAALVLSSLCIHINTFSYFLFPDDSRPYLIAFLMSILVFVFHILFYRFTLYDESKKLSKLGDTLSFGL